MSIVLRNGIDAEVNTTFSQWTATKKYGQMFADSSEKLILFHVFIWHTSISNVTFDFATILTFLNFYRIQTKLLSFGKIFARVLAG